MEHAQQIEALRRKIFAHGDAIDRMILEKPLMLHKAERKRAAAADIDRKVYAKILSDRHAMTLPNDDTTDDDLLAESIFRASCGGEETKSMVNGDTADDALAQMLFDASGDAGRTEPNQADENDDDDADERLAQQLFDRS